MRLLAYTLLLSLLVVETSATPHDPQDETVYIENENSQEPDLKVKSSDETRMEWEERLRLAMESVFQMEDLRGEIAANGPLENLTTLLSVSRDWKDPVEKALNFRYLVEGEIDWLNLLRDIRNSSASKRPAAYKFMLKHWPKAREGISSGLFIEALKLLKEALTDPYYEAKDLPYIPGHCNLYSALVDIKVIKWGLSPVIEPDDDNADDPRIYINFYHSYHDVKTLLTSGNEKAIAAFEYFYPRYIVEDNVEKPKMTFALEPDASVYLAIHYHHTSNHDELIKHLKQALETTESEEIRATIMDKIGFSLLSTEDVVDLLRPYYRYISTIGLVYPHRLLDVISNHGVDGIKVDIEKLREENFRGQYSEEIYQALPRSFFYMIAVMAGADDEIVMETVPDEGPHMTASAARVAVMTGRSVGVFEHLLQSTDAISVLNMFEFNQVPTEYLSALFKDKDVAIEYMRSLLTSDDIETKQLRQAVPLLNAELIDFLLETQIDGTNSSQVTVFFDLLFRECNKDTIRIIEKHYEEFWNDLEFRLALLAQNLEVLARLYYMVMSESMKSAVREVMRTKLDSDSIS